MTRPEQTLQQRRAAEGQRAYFESATRVRRRLEVEALALIGAGGPAPDWTDDALCPQIGPQLFTADDDPAASFLAKQACELCDVRAECVADALLDDARAGIRGGFPIESIRRDLGGVSGLAVALGQVAS